MDLDKIIQHQTAFDIWTALDEILSEWVLVQVFFVFSTSNNHAW